MPQTWRSASKTNPCFMELSALWEADQEQQLESADSMHARMKDLVQLVRDFARQAEQRSSALQEQVQQLEKQVDILTRQYALITADYKEIAALLRRV